MNKFKQFWKTDIAKSAEAQAERLMQIDNEIRGELNLWSGDLSHNQDYVMGVHDKVSGTYSQDVYDILEDNNYHSLCGAMSGMGKFHKSEVVNKSMNGEMHAWLIENAKEASSWQELRSNFKREFDEQDILDVIGNEFNVQQECEDYWRDENVDKSSKFKVGDRVTPTNTGEIDYGKMGTVRNVNSGGGVKVQFDDGESETFGDDELMHKSAKSEDDAQALQDVLLQEHLKEMTKKGAEDYNLGWASGDYFIHSKTSKGRLYSEINPKTKKVTHTWQ